MAESDPYPVAVITFIEGSRGESDGSDAQRRAHRGSLPCAARHSGCGGELSNTPPKNTPYFHKGPTMQDSTKNTRAVERYQGNVPALHCTVSYDDDQARVLDAGIDNIYFSYDVRVSDDVWYQLLDEQAQARAARDERGRSATFISNWLEAEVSPMGASGYPIVLLTDRWLVRLQVNNDKQPGIYIEMRSFLLHTHPGGVLGACEDACQWVREKFFADDAIGQQAVTLRKSRCSRLDLHVDWQGGWHPLMTDGEEKHFIKPGHTSWRKMMEGNVCTGYSFGKKRVMGRVYNKTRQVELKHLDWYTAYIAERGGAAYVPEQDMWRLEFELKRAGLMGFAVVSEQDIDDDDATIESELAGEDLPRLDSVPKSVHFCSEYWRYLAEHWLRLAIPSQDTNRARWAMHPTWLTLQAGFSAKYGALQLTDTQVKLVRAERHAGRGRFLARQVMGVTTTVAAMIAGDPAGVAMAYLENVERQARLARIEQEKKAEVRKLSKKGRYLLLESTYTEQLAHQALGLYTSLGVTKTELPPITCVADLLEACCDDLQAIADSKGGVSQLLFDKSCKLYKVKPAQRRIS